jgi:quinolinate synthase
MLLARLLNLNSLAEAKAYCDAVCTSANAAEIVNRMEAEVVLFGPDANLARYAQTKSDKEVVPIPQYGFCLVHKLFLLFTRKRKRLQKSY